MIRTHKHTDEGQAFTDIVLEVFRMNGRLIAFGDDLTAPFGLTSARWQIMGALAEGPAPAAHIARKMGLARQSVQRLVDILIRDGFVLTETNPHHRKAHLLRLSPAGNKRYESIMTAWSQIANSVAEACTAKQLNQILDTMRKLSERIPVIDKDRSD